MSVLFRYRIHLFVTHRKRLTSREIVISIVCVVIDMLRPARGATRCSDAQTQMVKIGIKPKRAVRSTFRRRIVSLTRTSRRPGWQRPTASGPLLFFNDWLAQSPYPQQRRRSPLTANMQKVAKRSDSRSFAGNQRHLADAR
jgi:hypothetical protein